MRKKEGGGKKKNGGGAKKSPGGAKNSGVGRAHLQGDPFSNLLEGGLLSKPSPIPDLEWPMAAIVFEHMDAQIGKSHGQCDNEPHIRHLLSWNGSLGAFASQRSRYLPSGWLTAQRAQIIRATSAIGRMANPIWLTSFLFVSGNDAVAAQTLSRDKIDDERRRESQEFPDEIFWFHPHNQCGYGHRQ